VDSHSPVGLVSWQWDTVDCVCVLCDRRIHNDRTSRSASSRQCACPFYSSRAGFSGKASHHPSLSDPLQPWLGSLQLMAFPKAKIVFESVEIFECDGHTVHKLSQRRLTADWLAPRESDCSRTQSKVSSVRLPSYMHATRTVLQIFKISRHFSDSPHILKFSHLLSWSNLNLLKLHNLLTQCSLIIIRDYDVRLIVSVGSVGFHLFIP